MNRQRRPPNMRVQRTRSSPSALRSPLTRHPLMAPLLGIALLVASRPSLGEGAGQNKWKAYKNEAIGFSLRVPPTWTIATGDEYYGMTPDVSISMPESDLRDAKVRRAFVAVYSSEEGYCAPVTENETLAPDATEQTLAGRRFSHRSWIEAAGSFGYASKTFSTRYRGKCFVIETIVDNPRVDYDENGDEIPRVEHDKIYRCRDKLAASLMKVVRTLVFLDPADANDQKK
jgi:hypothetical protein